VHVQIYKLSSRDLVTGVTLHGFLSLLQCMDVMLPSAVI